MAESQIRQWGQKGWAYKYLEIADIIVVGRRESLNILKSFYSHCVGKTDPVRILDLGCGDGILTRELLNVDSCLTATLVDGSGDMLEKARQSLSVTEHCSFIKATFQELIAGEFNISEIDLAVSSLAVHHLTSEEKKLLFGFVLSHLAKGGYFINIDTVRSASDIVEQWYLELWREGVRANKPSADVEASFEDMVKQYIEDEHYSKIDTLEDQMDMMKEVGFRNVECFYKRGMFAMYGGGN